MSKLFGSLAIIVGLAGCVTDAGLVVPAGPPAVACKPGVVFVVGGVGGIDPIGPAARLALPMAGVPHEIRDFVWTHGTGCLLKDLRDTHYVLTRAEELAQEIHQVKAADPDRPIYLVGHSGGAGLALAAAELLPPASLERIILLSAAVAPNYDLRPALRATCREIVSFNSCIDRFWLCWGTSHFGTIDRVYGPSAGLDGFVVPSDLDEESRWLYQRLVQVSWKPEMVLAQHTGLHHSTCMPGFLARQVAPWLMP
jgi:pimeloyl-ACP methyl ester carboxylesterase